MKKALLFLLLIVFLLTACAPSEPEHMASTGNKWIITIEKYEFKRVKTGSIDFGDGLSVPIYGNRWRNVDTIVSKGADKNPKKPSNLNCPMKKPDNPKIGDVYCQRLPTEYYLIFDDGDKRYLIEVTEDVWKSNSPGKIYWVQKVFLGLKLAD